MGRRLGAWLLMSLRVLFTPQASGPSVSGCLETSLFFGEALSVSGCVHAHLGNKIILQEQGSNRLIPKSYPVFDPKTKWQSQVEIEYYSVAYFDRVTTFEAL